MPRGRGRSANRGKGGSQIPQEIQLPASGKQEVKGENLSKDTNLPEVLPPLPSMLPVQAAADSSPAVEKMAIKLASLILEELRLETEWPDKDELIKILYALPPERNKLKKEGKHDPRNQLVKSVTNQNKAQSVVNQNQAPVRYFCICHGEFTMPSGTDLEHASPCKDTVLKQKRLLNYLNNSEHQNFAEFFLKQDGIKAYIRRDKKDGIIKGTGYFYKACYNAIDNLYLLCHACNISKGERNPLEWFEQQIGFFGPPFLEEIIKQGGYRDGVLFGRIFVKSGVPFSWDDGQIILLRESSSLGMGEFIRNWFLSRFSPVQEGQQVVYDGITSDVRARSIKIAKSIFAGEKEEKIHKKYRRLIKDIIMLSLYQKGVTHFHPDSASSGSDDSQHDETGRKNDFVYAEDLGKKVSISQYSIRKIRGLTKNLYQDKDMATRIKHCCQAWREKDTGIDWFQVFGEFRVLIEGQRQLPKENRFSEEQLKQNLEKLIVANGPRLRAEQRAEEEHRLKEQAEQKAEEEHQLKEQAEQKAEEEHQLKEQAEQKAEEERQLRKQAEQEREQERQEKEQERQLREQTEQKLAQILQSLSGNPQAMSLLSSLMPTFSATQPLSTKTSSAKPTQNLSSSSSLSSSELGNQTEQNVQVSSNLFSSFGAGVKNITPPDDLDSSYPAKKANLGKKEESQNESLDDANDDTSESDTSKPPTP